jgi:23S rRNA pseudouridine1911/1915/1917 synthase
LPLTPASILARILIQPAFAHEDAADYIGAMTHARAPENPGAAPADEDDDGDASAQTRVLAVPSALGGERLDKALAVLMPDVSRSRLQAWIESGDVRVNGESPRTRDKVLAGDRIDVRPQPAAEVVAFRAEPMALDIVYADRALAVVDKPPGLVVHPAAGNWSGTLLNGLLAWDAALAALPRAGIVHRLDADTSGLMVVARTAAAQTDLVRQLQARSVTREYWALVFGEAPAGGTIDAAIGRDPRNPLRFRVSRAADARPARTHFRRVRAIASDGTRLTWLACRLDTGRTHQIRVHLESIGHPLVGDRVYRQRRPTAGGPGSEWATFPRQALHACRLALDHPETRARCTWFRAPPDDMRSLMLGLGIDDVDAPIEVFE